MKPTESASPNMVTLCFLYPAAKLGRIFISKFLELRKKIVAGRMVGGSLTLENIWEWVSEEMISEIASTDNQSVSIFDKHFSPRHGGKGVKCFACIRNR